MEGTILILPDKWDGRFLALAEHVSHWSKDPSTKVGSVIVDDQHRIVSLGFNGFPRGINDTQLRLDNREEKYSRTIHAELNAILNASKSVVNCTLYTFPFPPCDRCAITTIQAGIRKVVSPSLPHDLIPRWGEACARAVEYFNEARVEIVLV